MPEARIAHHDPVLFVSDVHLRHGDVPYLEQFLRFLDRRARAASALYVHGDLFEFYVGSRQGRLPFYAPLFRGLEDLIASGTAVTVLHGNRDYLIGRQFESCGVRVVADELELRLGGLDVHLSHGDQFCIHDRSYQFWARGVLRSWPARALVSSLPGSAAIALARSYRAISRRKVARRAASPRASRLPSILDGVQRLLDRKRYDAVICGHIHHLAETPLDSGGRRCVLYTTGAWEDGPNHVAYEDGRLRACSWAGPQD